METEWYGQEVSPAFGFRFELGETLRFEAWRAAPAVIHPGARAGVFQEELWRYDVVEYFISTAAADRYMELNLCANGAWWAAGFSEPRKPLEGFDGRALGIKTCGEESLPGGGWRCRAELPVETLRRWGWEPAESRMAAAAVICREGRYTYLTTCEQRQGKPDFHRPWDWEPALLL